jgi:Saxitoxin biosynthesis operon protein SxtJ
LTSTALEPSGVADEAKELRKFGLVIGAAFALIFGLLLPWLFSFSTPLWPFIVCAALVIPALVAPNLLRPVQRGWMRLAEPIGRFNTKLILGLVFYLVFTPVGAIRRLIADPLVLRKGRSESYRKPSRQRTAESMERPF